VSPDTCVIRGRPVRAPRRERSPRRAGRCVLRAILVVLSLLAPARAEDTNAAGGSAAFRHVLELAGTVGPRKSGTDADGRAIEYVAREMEAAGLSVTRQAVPISTFDEGERSVGSWNLIGELAGATRDTIVLAAHHDSRSTAVPGANDDASGVAVLLEVARAVARRPHRLTYRFISFCAEEEGLLGSRYYVEHADLSPVRVMIALELVGRGELLVGPVPRPPAFWAQRLLLQAAQDTGARGVVARPLWTLAPRFLDLPFGADHEAFLERRIPAFLVLGTYPAWTYHTTEDGVSGVRPEALDRAVRVVGRILQDLDASPAAATDDPHYLPVMLFGRGFLLPSKSLLIVSCASLLGWGLLALRRVRAIARPRAIVETVRVLIVTGAATAIGLSGLFLSERVMERIHEVRYPWIAHQGLYVAQAIAWALFTSWIGLNLFRRIKPTVEPGPYLAAAFILPVAWVAAALHEGFPEIAVIMAVPVLMFLASRNFESTGRKLALGLGALAPFFCLITLRDYRTLVDLGGVSPSPLLLFGSLFSVAFPMALYLAHVASFQDCLHSRAWWWLSSRRVGLAAVALSLVLLVVNAILPPYDYRNRQVVRVRERVDLDGRRVVATIRSTDHLRGVRILGGGGRVIDPMETTESIDLPFPLREIDFTADAVPATGPGETVVTTHLRAPVATDRISYVFSSRSGFLVPGRGIEVRHRYTFTEAVPRRDPIGTFHLVLPEGGDLSVELRADFEEDVLGLRPSSDLPQVFVHQATIEGSRHLLGATHPASPHPADGAPRDR
jgi:peptidase M28-like protein